MHLYIFAYQFCLIINKYLSSFSTFSFTVQSAMPFSSCPDAWRFTMSNPVVHQLRSSLGVLPVEAFMHFAKYFGSENPQE